MSTEFIPATTGSHFIRRILTPAIRFWLNTQIEQAHCLSIEIDSGDRQILQGYIPTAQISAHQVVYQGLHFRAIDVVAHNIRTNGLQVLRGKPFQLLEPISIDVCMSLSEADLNRSLQASLLANAVDELMQQIVFSRNLQNPLISEELSDIQHVVEPQVVFQHQVLVLTGKMMQGDRPLPIRLETSPVLVNGHTLALKSPLLTVERWESDGRSPTLLDDFLIDLGDTTHLTELVIEPQGISCRGQILVMP